MPPAKPLVLDTSAILSGRPLESLTQGAAACSPTALSEEVTPGGRDHRAVAYALETGLTLKEPSTAARARVDAAARETGDHARLSAMDRDVVALALDVDGIVLSDDYSVQNVAARLGVPYRGVAQEGIRDVWTWTWRCRGCRRTFDTQTGECPVCGSDVRQVRKR